MAQQDIQILEGEISNDYKWNPGGTVGRFLTKLRDDGELTAVRCNRTSKVYLPPQSWSPYGNIKMDRFVPVSGQAKLFAGTIVYQAPWNLPEGVSPPYMLAAISYPGVDSQFLHLVVASEAELKALQPGAHLKPQLKDPAQREGTIRDIEYYRPE